MPSRERSVEMIQSEESECKIWFPLALIFYHITDNYAKTMRWMIWALSFITMSTNWTQYNLQNNE